MSDVVLERVRAYCLALPEVTERLSHGAPTFFVRDKKTFVIVEDNPDERLSIWCHAPRGVQDALLGQHSERYFVPPYVGTRGWIGVRLDRGVDWDEVEDLIEDAYRMVAPKSLIARLGQRERSEASGNH
jgi:hypothetical protein